MKKVVFVQGLSELLQIMDYSLLWAYHILGYNDAIENRSTDKNVSLSAFVSSPSFLPTFGVDHETFLLLETIPHMSVKKYIASVPFFPLFWTFWEKTSVTLMLCVSVSTRDHCDHMQ